MPSPLFSRESCGTHSGTCVPNRRQASSAAGMANARAIWFLEYGGGDLQLFRIGECRAGINDGKPVVTDLVSLGSGNDVMPEFVGNDAAGNAKRKPSPLRARIVKRPAPAVCVRGPRHPHRVLRGKATSG